MRRPKGVKTKKSVAKRFKITASGKVLRSRAGKRHLLQTKNPKRRRGLTGTTGVHPTDVYRIKQNLPFSRSLVEIFHRAFFMRVTNAPASRKRRTRMIRAAKGFRMRRSKLYRYASDAIDHGRQYAFRDRKTKKRNFRALWQIRINAAARAAGMTYSRLMEGLKAARIALDRKIIADLAATDAPVFGELVKVAQNALKAKASKS